ncbi:valine--tRNA ligase [Halorientalis pallida]|uniref:Valine--tRNA ligase n=1 Tax=Halorientalis pallida TaxID=2479928 RepID=A0A498KX07_9EURY|nr:valine--tRNA ligase [Halorientalis pallida]RXK47292.1 valine--tRNA ligase [Halorientalis pallida]
MSELPDNYDPDQVEPKWRDEWQDMDVYEYQDDGDTDYVVDTPPPYPTGNLHIGNALGWCYMDFAARYHRLVGDDVLFPQGWDCHGLPTEVKVEENNDIHRTDVPRDEFRQMCIEHTEDQIDAMKETMGTLGFSQDWNHEFRTMDPEYWGTTQRSFVEMADDDLVYRDEHPVNWCPRCETAIADAEVETEEGVDGTLYYVTFEGADEDSEERSSSDSAAEPRNTEDIEIATTRPELLAACVSMAVHPDDERYADRIGDRFEVPLFGHEVELIADEESDPEFGTGAVMICTFGDKQDVEWWAEHDLDLRMVFTEDGHLNDDAGEYAGLTIDEAKEEIADDLDDEGYLEDTEPTEQAVGQCWRCDTPIEILSKEQWFVEVDQDAILERAQQVEWIPEHMYDRLEDWTTGMEWDWVISRQRVFATPIPAWFCQTEDCDHIHIAGPGELPVEPTDEGPGIEACPECGGDEWTGETDVMDTWMDSSITPLYVRGWPDEEFEPTTLREQGHDIIRTWAFYTLLRTGEIADDIPWEEALINGMVFGEDGNKMSKSRGNFVQPEEAVEEYSADAFRQAMALGGQPGSDIQFQWKEVKSASKFGTKIWNITKFASGHLDTAHLDRPDPAYRDADKWILSRTSQVADSVADHMDDYRFDAALRELREFVWHDLADDYLELIKGRLYEGRPGEANAARQALATALSASLRMLSPFAPFLTEEAYDGLPHTEGSVHAADWPDIDMHDEDAEIAGELIAEVAATVRGWKSDAGIALNAELDKIEVYPEETPERAVDTYDLSEAVNAPVHVREGVPAVELVPVEIDPDHSVIGPEFGEQTGRIVGALEAADPEDVKQQKQLDGEIELDLGEEVAVVPGDAVEIHEEHRAESGEEVEVVESDLSTILIYND